MHRLEDRYHCSHCSALGVGYERIRIRKGNYARMCPTCRPLFPDAVLQTKSGDRRPYVRIDIWECDICKTRVEGLLPADWRDIYTCPGDDEVRQIHICPTCVVTKALADVPWEVAAENMSAGGADE